MQNQALLMTKLMPPAVRSEAVVRERLHARIREGADRALTLVSAGPGFGKSTLLAAWREEELPGRAVAWLSLAESEDDPVALCIYVVEAIRAVRPEFGEDALAALATSAPAPDEALRRLVNALAVEDSLALVLDDFHRIRNGEAQRVVAWLAENCPVCFQLVVATRTDPLLPLAALRAHGELVELRAADLALTAPEAEEFLNGRLRLDLSTNDVRALIERTEGWPAGLYLAALSIPHAHDPHEFVSRFGASSRHVVDFLVDEVLQRQPAELQAFMLRCSVLERLSGQLCDAVLERRGSQETLAALSKANLFLTALGDRAEWYRFHRLFADVLRNELGQREPELPPVLHRRAATWHREAGDVESAIGYALAGGAFDVAADLIAENWNTYLNAGKAASVRAWLDRLPVDVLSARPELMRAQVHVAFFRSDIEREGLLEALMQRYSDGAGASYSAALAQLWSGDAGAALASIRGLVAAEPRDSSLWASACESLGWILYVNDELDESARWLHEARAVALAAEQWVVAAMAAAALSLVATEQRRPSEQQDLAEEAYACLEEHGLADASGYAAVVHTARGVALAARGQLGQALEPLERGLSLRPATRFEVLDAIVPLIAVVHELGDRERAGTLLVEARTILAECPDPGGLRRRLAAVQRRLDPNLDRRQQGGDLTAAEVGVLQLLEAGLSERQVGRELYLSFNTVHSHVKSIYRKLGVSSRQEALDQARSLGLSSGGAANT